MSITPCAIAGVVIASGNLVAKADDLLYRYEGDVFPYDAAAAWLVADACSPPCSEALEWGHFALRWERANNIANYHYWIARPPDQPPPSLWVEWSFRSNHPMPRYSFDCDGFFNIRYGDAAELANMYGDAVVSFSGDDFVLGLDIEQFHTYRFESEDGLHYRISVDGLIFIDAPGVSGSGIGYHYLQFGGIGGCNDDQIPNMVNEWGFIRYGAISYGEQIVSSDPTGGYIDARQHPMLDRFTVTYDQPNYVYIDEISVEVLPIANCKLPISGGVPVVIATRRLDNAPPDVVEIVLDRPISYSTTTRFTFNDGVAVNVVEFTYAPGDTDGDGDADLADFAAFQICFGKSPVAGVCLPLDFNADDDIDLLDFAEFQKRFGTL